MARYQHLPLYQSVYALCVYSYRIKLKLSKSLKHDLGQSLCEQVLRSLKMVAVANQHRHKSKILEQLAIEQEGLWAVVRLLFDLNGITAGEYRIICEMLADIGKQISAWRRWESEQQKKSPPP